MLPLLVKIYVDKTIGKHTNMKCNDIQLREDPICEGNTCIHLLFFLFGCVIKAPLILIYTTATRTLTLDWRLHTHTLKWLPLDRHVGSSHKTQQSTNICIFTVAPYNPPTFIHEEGTFYPKKHT